MKFVIFSILISVCFYNKAFDDNYKGFILGGGFGTSYQTVSRSDYGYEYPIKTVNALSLSSKFRIGVAPHQRIALLIINHNSSTFYNDSFNNLSNTSFALQYTQPHPSGSFHIIAGPSLGKFDRKINNSTAHVSYKGNGFIIATGYEIKKHIQLELAWNKIINNFNIASQYHSVTGDSIGLSVNYIWY